MIGNTPWPNVLDDFKAKRDALNAVIATIETHFFNPAHPDELPESPTSARRGKPGPKPSRHKKIGRTKRIEKRQTDRQTDRAKGGPSRSAEPP